MTQVKRAQSLPQDFTKIDETLNILRNTDINTGLGAALFTVLDKARAQVAADKKAGKRAVNTEYLDALLGSDVFPQIQALGIGARGLDTPAERDSCVKC
jgi:acyl-CoA reductase-like NAD-dependent aldehyde dehydrogenase